MTPQNFAYWLQGYFELSTAKTLDMNQVRVIRNHLNLVKKCLAEPQTPGQSPGFPSWPTSQPTTGDGGLYRC